MKKISWSMLGVALGVMSTMVLNWFIFPHSNIIYLRGHKDGINASSIDFKKPNEIKVDHELIEWWDYDELNFKIENIFDGLDTTHTMLTVKYRDGCTVSYVDTTDKYIKIWQRLPLNSPQIINLPDENTPGLAILWWIRRLNQNNAVSE